MGVRARADGPALWLPLEREAGAGTQEERPGASVLRDRRTHRERFAPVEALPIALKTVPVPGVRAQLLAGDRGRNARAVWLARFEALSLRCAEVRRELLGGLAGDGGRGTGIPAECLALPTAVGPVFRCLLRHPAWDAVWRVAAPVYGRVALARIRSASALVSFALEGPETPEGLVGLGAAFTRYWLGLTAEGLAAQPYSSFVYPRLCGRRCGLKRCLVAPESWQEHFSAKPEIVFRVGRPTRRVPPRPHRPLEDVLAVEE